MFFSWSFYVRVKINILLNFFLGFNFFFGCSWFQDVERKFSVKTLNEKCKALKDIDKGLSNKDASKTYGVPPNTISTWIKNKENISKLWKTIVPAKNEN